MVVITTLESIKLSLLVLTICFCMFGVPMTIINNNHLEDELVVAKVFDFWIIDMLLNQYLTALGEFDMDNFNDKP